MGSFKSSRITACDGLNGDFIEVFVEPGNRLDRPNLFTFTETDPVTLEYTGP